METNGKGRNLAFFKIQNDVYLLRSGFIAFSPISIARIYFDLMDVLISLNRFLNQTNSPASIRSAVKVLRMIVSMWICRSQMVLHHHFGYSINNAPWTNIKQTSVLFNDLKLFFQARKMLKELSRSVDFTLSCSNSRKFNVYLLDSLAFVAINWQWDRGYTTHTVSVSSN